MIEKGVNINKVTDHGDSALSQAIRGENRACAELLLKNGSKIFHEKVEHRDNSPFFQAIMISSIWGIELFCDHGADVNTTNASGQNPLIFSALRGLDDICMYLSLRTDDVNLEDSLTGLNVLTIYLLKPDLTRCQQLLMRGANVNYTTKREGLTSLHHLITRGAPE